MVWELRVVAARSFVKDSSLGSDHFLGGFTQEGELVAQT
jgi:hypothetical protein